MLALDDQIGIWGGAWEGYKSDSKRRQKTRPTFRRQNPTRDDVGNTSGREDDIEDDDDVVLTSGGRAHTAIAGFCIA